MFTTIKKQLALSLLGLLIVSSAFAASHREAPLISNDPAADITDFYVFRSPEDPEMVVFAMNVIPAQGPSSGPNYFNFDDEVLYEIYIDNNKNNIARNITYQFRFKTEIRPPGDVFPLSFAALPPITALDGPGSEGFFLRQSYTVTEKRFGQPDKDLGTFFAVPSNVGSRTMPDYEALAAQGVFPLSNGGRVFVGQRDETFYIDLGGVFDTLNLHAPSPILSIGDDADDFQNLPDVPDTFSGMNVNTIAIEVPIVEVVGAGGNTMIGAYAATSRPRVRVIRRENKRSNSSFFAQVARMGNPLINELITPTQEKDAWNATFAEFEKQFLGNYCDSALATALNVVFGTGFPTSGRSDLANLLLRYGDIPITDICDPNTDLSTARLADFLRLDLAVSPTDPVDQKRLGPFAHDAAGASTPDASGWPNGRRPNDDVTDIVIRAVAGALIDPATPMLGDGVNFNSGAPGTNTTPNGIAVIFPFLPTPHSGRN